MPRLGLTLLALSAGLAPDTVYRVTVRAKNIRAPHFDEKHNLPLDRYSSHIDFVTLPKGASQWPTALRSAARLLL